MPGRERESRADPGRSTSATAVALAEAADEPIRDADLVRAGLRRGSADVLARRGVLLRVGRGLFTTPAKAAALGLKRFGAKSNTAALIRLRALRRPLTDQLLARFGLRHRAANLLRQELLERALDGPGHRSPGGGCCGGAGRFAEDGARAGRAGGLSRTRWTSPSSRRLAFRISS